jgi:hypothetical protein
LSFVVAKGVVYRYHFVLFDLHKIKNVNVKVE